jgi:DNA-directed RNA polymerase specialized sigma24 family protein
MDAAPDARHAAPGDLALANDLWERMLALTPPEHHPVLALRREGLPLAEIAARVGMHEGSVRRVLRRLARELALEGQDGSPDVGPEG